MSITYPAYSFSSYPDEIDTFDRFTDLTLDTIEYAKQYNTYMINSNLTSAAQVLIEHPELKTSLINAANLNRLIDAVKAIENFYIDDVQTYILELVTYLGSYSSTTKYTKYNVVEYNSMIYMCTSLTTPLGTLPTDTTYWYPLSIKGETGEPGLGLSFLGTWDSNTVYPKDAAVSYGTSLYASLVDDNTSHTPSKTSEYWSLIIDFNTVTSFDNSSSGTTETTMQGALEELYSKVDTNTSKLNTVESGAQVNTITGIKGSAESNYRTGNVNITPANLGITVINNTADSQKSVKNADTVDGVHFHPNDASGAPSGHGYVYGFSGGDDYNAWVYPTTQMSVKYADSSGTATNANYASSAGNSDTVDGYHIQISTTDLTAGSSSLTTNVIYLVYE